ncbi:MAG: hypothetical protein R6W94_05775, partial [Spirochaetia bacterium]
DSFTVPLRSGDSDPDGDDGGEVPEASQPGAAGGGALREVEVRLLGPAEPGVARVESVLVYREAERVAGGAGAAGPGGEAGEEGSLP